jgi:hypothetical protein
MSYTIAELISNGVSILVTAAGVNQSLALLPDCTKACFVTSFNESPACYFPIANHAPYCYNHR